MNHPFQIFTRFCGKIYDQMMTDLKKTIAKYQLIAAILGAGLIILAIVIVLMS